MICLHKVKLFRVILSYNTSYILYESFVFIQIKYFQVLQFNINDSIYKVFLSNTNN